MTSKSKKDKIKQGNQRDFDLLYDVLVNGGTYSDYRSELLDRSMPQELQNFNISEDDILAAWILGKDEESELYARGGHIHQEEPWILNPNNKGIWLLYKNLNQNSFTSGSYNSTTAPKVDTDLQESTGSESMLGKIGTVLQIADMADKGIGIGLSMLLNGVSGANNDPYRGAIYRDYSNGFISGLFNQPDTLDALNRINSSVQSFGTGDSAYLKSQYEQYNPIDKSYSNPIFGGEKRRLNVINNAVDIANNQSIQNFNTAVTNSNRLNLWNQLSQPYMAACGGKMKNRLASGGYINSHYDYITDPLVRVEAGGTHQENPNEGVLTSMAPDGKPNLVEQGETIIDNGREDAYVFSDRIVADEEILKSHLLPVKFVGKTYADISKELDKIIEEHKNDEISKRTFDEMISRLQQAQEDQKYQEKAEEVAKFIDGLSDEEKEQLEQTMIEEAQSEQQAAEEQAIAEQQAQEQAAQEQQMQSEQAPEQVAMEQPQEQVVPSRYDEMMNRAAITDAANGGMFGRGGHLNLIGNKLDFDRYNYIKTLYDQAYNNRYGDNRDYYNYPGFTDNYILQLRAIDKFNDEDMFKLLYKDLYPYLNTKFVETVAPVSSSLNDLTNVIWSPYKPSPLASTQNNTKYTFNFKRPGYNSDLEDPLIKNILPYKPSVQLEESGANIKTTNLKAVNIIQPSSNTSILNYPKVTNEVWKEDGEFGAGWYPIEEEVLPMSFGNYIPDELRAEEINDFTDRQNAIRDLGRTGNTDAAFEYWQKNGNNNSNANTISTKTPSVVTEPDKDEDDTADYTTDWSTYLRFAPAVGSGIQYLSDLFGITNRNDYTNPNLFQRSINAIPNVGFTPIGGYRTFNPFDETYQLNVLRSANEAARRAVINNSNGNYGATMAALNALNYNEGSQFGDLALKAREYNEKERQVIDEYNLKINQINSSLSMSAQEKNQAIAALKARLTAALAEMRQQIEDTNDAARSANMTNFYQNLGNVGKENFNMTMVRSNPAFYYTITDDGHILYKNGFDGLNERDLAFVRSVAEPQAEEQRKKHLEEANKKADDTTNKQSDSGLLIGGRNPFSKYSSFGNFGNFLKF